MRPLGWIWLGALLATVTLVWTNPPELDLAGIRFYAARVVLDADWYTTDTLDLGAWVPRCPGCPDTAEFQLPCRSSAIRWRFWCEPFDTAGNVRRPGSNVLTLRFPFGTRGARDSVQLMP